MERKDPAVPSPARPRITDRRATSRPAGEPRGTASRDRRPEGWSLGPRPEWLLAAALALGTSPGFAQSQTQSYGKVGQGGGLSTKVGDNRGGTNVFENQYKEIQKLKNQVETLKDSSGKSRSTGGGRPAFTGRIKVLGSTPPPLTWRERVDQARAALPLRDRAELLRRLREEEDPAEAFAILSLENEGRVRFTTGELGRTLNRTRARIVARAAALLLSRRPEAEAKPYLVEHVKNRGPADDTALELLTQYDARQNKELLMRLAGQATARDSAGLQAIRALAYHPGPDVVTLLRRLEQDWAPEIQQAAKEALELRDRVGLQLQTPYKAPPVGPPVSELAKEVPVGSRAKRGASDGDSEDAEDGE